MKKVFLGGICNDSAWREELIPLLKIDFFDPVVAGWTEEAQSEEDKQKQLCDFCLFVITPKMTGLFSIAEVVQASLTKPKGTTLFCVLSEDCTQKFKESQLKSLAAIKKLVVGNGAKAFDSIKGVAEHLNSFFVEPAYNCNLIECVIERDGPTQMQLGKASYVFEENALGDYVCEVLSQAHRKHLLSIPEFRIYQSDKAPKAEFSQDEESFISCWNILSPEAYLAYVNGHVKEINAASQKIRSMAIGKWEKQLPGMASCPIVDGSVTASPEKFPVAPLHDEESSEQSSSQDTQIKLTAFEQRFYASWQRINAPHFKKAIKANEQAFLDLPPQLWDKAKEKWSRLITDTTGEPWPFEEGVQHDRS